MLSRCKRVRIRDPICEHTRKGICCAAAKGKPAGSASEKHVYASSEVSMQTDSCCSHNFGKHAGQLRTMQGNFDDPGCKKLQRLLWHVNNRLAQQGSQPAMHMPSPETLRLNLNCKQAACSISQPPQNHDNMNNRARSARCSSTVCTSQALSSTGRRAAVKAPDLLVLSVGALGDDGGAILDAPPQQHLRR